MGKLLLRILLFSLALSLAAQTITVTSPAGGPRWCRGQVQEISWTSSGLTARGVGIYLRQGSRNILDISANSPLNGTFPWRIPATLAPGNYFIQVGAIGQRISGASELFSIADCGGSPPPPPGGISITVNHPSRGVTWNTGSNQTITWTPAGALDANVKIDLVMGAPGNMLWIMNIAPSVPTANGSLAWTLPANLHTGDSYQVQVCTVDGRVCGESAPFTIQKIFYMSTVLPPAPATGPRLTIIAPNGGENLRRGSLFDISWRLDGPLNAPYIRDPFMRVELTNADGSVVDVIFPAPINIGPGHVGWYVGGLAGRSAPSGSYKIKISFPYGTTDGNVGSIRSIEDSSDSTFNVID